MLNNSLAASNPKDRDFDNSLAASNTKDCVFYSSLPRKIWLNPPKDLGSIIGHWREMVESLEIIVLSRPLVPTSVCFCKLKQPLQRTYIAWCNLHFILCKHSSV